MKPVSVWTHGTRSGVGWNRFHCVVWTGLKSGQSTRPSGIESILENSTDVVSVACVCLIGKEDFNALSDFFLL